MRSVSIILTASVLFGLSCQTDPQTADIDPGRQESDANARISGNVPSHDPSTIARSGSTNFIFNTGNYIPMGTSSNLINWGGGSNVFNSKPSWINSVVPGFGTQFWAPDLAYFNGRWNLYYSCSTFGSSTSAIGLVTAPTISANGTQWTDRGQVVRSSSNSDVNAIDASILVDGSSVYMAYGSFFGGIGLYRIDPGSGKPTGGRTIVAGGGGSDWEAPCMVKEGGYYYMFVNRGRCCQGSNSTYYIVVGRSSSPFGSYVDKNGRSLTAGGGTFVLGNQGRYIGPGHLSRMQNSQTGSVHYYDGNDGGNPKLETVRFSWSGGWPTVAYQ
jgi:arabinan endo-1,5-alpha-L-arabinosidase